MNAKRFIFGLVLIGVLAGCRATTLPVSPRIAALRQAGKLRVATAITRPFEFHDERTHMLVGFDVDLAQAIARPIGVPIVWKEMEFADLLPALQAGQADLVIAAMYITPVRSETVDFSRPYLDTGLVVVVRADETSINGLNDLPGKIVGVKEGATGARYAESLKEQGVPISVRRYLETQDSLEELEKGYVDAVFNDRLNTLAYMQTHHGVKIVGGVFDPAGLGIAVRKGDQELSDYVNGVLQSMQASGELARLQRKWIGSE